MASVQDIITSASINLLSALAFLLAFAFLRLQPINDRVYFPKWYLKGIRASPRSSGHLKKFVNLDIKTYLKFWTWMPAALRMPEPELIDHAGLDSAVYIRIYLLGLKIFVPIALLAFAVLVPVNWTGRTLASVKDLTFSDIDKLSISNVPPGSIRTSKDLNGVSVIIMTRKDQFTVSLYTMLVRLASIAKGLSVACVLVRNVPPDPDESVSKHVEHFFCVNHPDHYLAHQEAAERERVMSDPKAIVPAAFVSFKSRWGAAVCAQTQQSSNPTIWLTEWAPEPRDVYWDNLAIPYVELAVKRLITAVAMGKVKSVVQGFLPGIALKIFLIFLPTILMILSKIEGLRSLSSLDRKSAGKYHLFILVNVFFGSIITGAAFQQLHKFLNQSPSEIPRTVGVAIPMKATFFITYIMVDGWAGIAAEILRLVPLIVFHLKNTFLVKTEQDREQAMDPGCINFASSEPRIQLYFLLGLVYSVVTPFIIPFIIVFFAFAYVVFRHQIINVYDQKYESAAAFWPDVHRRIIIGLIISQLLLMGLLSTKSVAQSTPLLLVLPVLTIWFHQFCKGRFESAFVKFPLQDTMVKDTLERATEPNLNLKAYLQDAYLHPVFKSVDIERPAVVDEEDNNPLVSTKRSSRRSSKTTSGGVTPEPVFR
ncbi:hypothetical protein DH2020_024837 [Rehmannia glutinosa]|uniref:CSC1-like protein n=1 Tax=Rehmannia glutinosa TaxID=99300 RepID=A0ABR0W595_REHGL